MQLYWNSGREDRKKTLSSLPHSEEQRRKVRPSGIDPIIKLAKKDSNKRKSIFNKIKKHTKVDVKKTNGKKIICGF